MTEIERTNGCARSSSAVEHRPPARVGRDHLLRVFGRLIHRQWTPGPHSLCDPISSLGCWLGGWGLRWVRVLRYVLIRTSNTLPFTSRTWPLLSQFCRKTGKERTADPLGKHSPHLARASGGPSSGQEAQVERLPAGIRAPPAWRDHYQTA